MIRALLVWLAGELAWSSAWCLAFHHLSQVELSLIGVSYGIPASAILVVWWDERGNGRVW